MTASIKEREDKLCDREDYVEYLKKIKLENKEEQLNQLTEFTWKRKRVERKTGFKDRLKRTKTVSYLTGTHWMDKEQRLAERVLKNCGSKKRLSVETASKLADKTRELTQGRRPDGRDEALKRLEAPRGP